MKSKLWMIACCVLALNSNITEGKYRICVVDGRGGFQKASKYCPTLQLDGSEVECVQGLDRFDCLGKIRKGKADFSIFTPEDLVAAGNTYNDILITNELRTSQKEKYEVELVAIVSESSGIESPYDLKDKILCHPGYANDGIISTVLKNFLETLVVRPQSCDVSLTVPENRILSTSKFFKAACKPGPWVNDKDLDYELKGKYPNLCHACSSPNTCSQDDQYFGNGGSLLCLRDGSGDIAWTTLAQAKVQFELGKNSTKSKGFKFLCWNDGTRPLDGNPCIWVAKPYSVVAASSSSSSAVKKIISNLTHDGLPWQRSLMDLLEVVNYHIEIHTLDSAEPVDSYLLKIPGFLSANSFTGCHPPRTVKVCTTSIPSKYKCDWMREAASVRGVEPDIDCLKADNVTHCMKAIKMDQADVVMVEPDFVHTGISKYNLETLFYETVKDADKYLTVAVVRQNSNLLTFKDLMGKKACFPMHGGIGWNSVVNKLKLEFSSCPFEKGMEDFFGNSCVPNIPMEYKNSLGKLCGKEYQGDFGAMDCLLEQNADVAFISKDNLEKYLNTTEHLKMSDIRILCEKEPCHLSWSPPGQAMVYHNLTSWRKKDILDAFLELDLLFGKNWKEATKVFTMYGKYNGLSNILFHDSTKELRKVPVLKNFDTMPLRYGDILERLGECRILSASTTVLPSVLLSVFSVLFVLLR